MLESKFVESQEPSEEDYPCLMSSPNGTIHLMDTATTGTVVMTAYQGYPLGKRVTHMDPEVLTKVKGTITLEAV